MKTYRRVVDWIMRTVLFGTLCLLLVAIVVPDIGHGSFSVRTRMMGTRLQIESFCKAVNNFKTDNGFYPNSTNGLEALIKQPPNAPDWRGPYLMTKTGIPADPWGTPYHFDIPGHHGTNAFDIISAGPDKTFGTTDDIGNWLVR